MSRQPDLIYYSNKLDLKDFDILAQCKTATEYISPSLNVYSDKELTNPIGKITSRILQDKELTSYTGYVQFKTFKGSLTYYNLNLEDYYSSTYINTIIAGSGDLLGVTGYVAVLRSEELKYLTNYVYFDKK